jgi:hypothetical protein
MKSSQLISGYDVAFLDLYVARPEYAALETGLLKRPRIEKYGISKIYNNIKNTYHESAVFNKGTVPTNR